MIQYNLTSTPVIDLQLACPVEIRVSNWNTRTNYCINESCLTSADPQAQALYSIVKKIYEFFLNNFSLCGINGKGELPPLYFNWNVNNAQWACGDREGSCIWRFNDVYISEEVVAHEYVHGIINRFSQLKSQSEAGAINESLADVFGVIFKGTLKQQDWKVGGFRNISERFTIKNLKETEPKYDRDGNSTNDEGNVHDNSRFLSHAFYLAVQKTRRIADISFIWFETIVELIPDETFQGFAEKTFTEARKKLIRSVETASQIYLNYTHQGDFFVSQSQESFNGFVEKAASLPDVDQDAANCQAIYQAWLEVGINITL